MSRGIWNMYETGCRIGVAKNQYVYTARAKANIALPIYNSRELVVLFGCSRATGAPIKLTVIVDLSAV